VIVGGALWGNCNWGRGDVNVNVNRYNNFNRTNISNTNWQHNAANRGSVPYRDQKVAQQYGRGQNANAASRDQFRGRAESGQQAIQRGDVSRDSVNRAQQAGGGQRDFGGASASQRDFSNRGGGGGASAFETRGGGAQTRDYSNRGASSMNSARSSGNMGGGARAGGGGGGGARGGGGGGRGGGGRR